MSSLRVLYFAPNECWPPNTGAKLRNYHLVRSLSQRAKTTYLGFSDTCQSKSVVPTELPSFCDQVITVVPGRRYSLTKLIRGAIGTAPVTVLNYTTGSMAERLKRLLDERHFDVVQVEGIHLIAYLPIIRSAPSNPVVTCDWHNIESELMLRYSAKTGSLARRVYSRGTARRLVSLERRALEEFDAHIVVSNRDRDRLMHAAPPARIFVVENGVDSTYYSMCKPDEVQPHAPAPDQAARRRRVLFVGSMDYHANADAVIDFVNSAWPVINRRRPDLIFTIVGRRPSKAVRQLARIPNVEVTGTVDDVRPYYAEAIAAVAPLRVGGGSRIKILEAMAAGVPVVSTRLGSEGLDVTDGENILTADSPELFAESIAALCEQPELRRTIVNSALSVVRRRYDWSVIGTKLVNIHEEILSRRRGRRVSNLAKPVTGERAAELVGATVAQ